MDLVEHNYQTNRNVKFYADKLFYTPKYLSKIINDNTGKSASEWINNYVLMKQKHC